MDDFGAKNLRLENFRNYTSAEVEFSPGFNVIAGANAQGKTNLLEAMVLLSTTRVLRGKRDGEVVRQGETIAKAEAILGQHDTLIGVTVPSTGRKHAFLNGLGLPRAADLIGRLPSVCITAENLGIVRGEPAERRLTLDLDLSALYPAYLKQFTIYQRALKQRNALLKQTDHGYVEPEMFETWEEQLASSGAEIRRFREDYLEALKEPASEAHAAIGQGEAFTLRSMPADEAVDPEALREALARSRSVDVHRNGTSVGPHRDDYLIEVQGQELRLFGSQGQQRTALIAIRLGSLELASSILGARPLLLLDDVFSDLDKDRRRLLADTVLNRAGQTVLTCTEATLAGPHILDQAKIFQVNEGVISAA